MTDPNTPATGENVSSPVVAPPAPVVAPPVPAALKPKREKKIAPIVLPIRADLQMPKPEERPTPGNKAKYILDALRVGTSIGVKNRTSEELSTTISTANRKDWPVLDAKGKPVLNTDGTPKTEKRHFFAVNVADPASDPDGADSRIWRDK